MALIECPECKKQLSDAIDVCIHCGAHIRICPECRQVLVENARTCPNCGFVISPKEEQVAHSPQPTDRSCSNSAPSDKQQKHEKKDLQTVMKEFKIYDTEFKLLMTIIRVLGVVLIVIPFAIILPLFAITFVSLVKNTGSLDAAHMAMQLLFELSDGPLDLFMELAETCFYSADGENISVLGIINFFICFLVNAIFTDKLYTIIQHAAIMSKARGTDYDYGKTLKRLKKDYENDQSSTIDLEETQDNLIPWKYALRAQDGMETLMGSLLYTLHFIMTLSPLTYALVYAALYNAGSDYTEIVATSTLIVLFITWFIFSHVMEKMRNKRKLALLQKCEESKDRKWF